MQSTSLPPQLDDLTDDECERLLMIDGLRSLADVLATVPDPRSRHGRRYDLPFLLTYLVAAMLCNCNSLEEVGEWCQEHRTLLRRVFGARRHLTPTGSLYRWLLPQLSAAHLEWALAGWVRLYSAGDSGLSPLGSCFSVCCELADLLGNLPVTV